MKKYITILLLSACSLLLAACGTKNQTEYAVSGDREGKENKELSSQEQPGPMSYAFEAQYIRTNGYSEDRSYPYHVIIDSREELETYYEENKDIFDLERKEAVYSDTTIGFLDACDKYDDAYFGRQNLVLIVLEEGSGSIRHKIKDVRPHSDEKNNTLDGWDITIDRIVPGVGTDDMAQWHLFLEVQMGDVIKSDTDVWINGKLSSAVPVGTNIDATESSQYEVPVDWSDFIKFEGVTYDGDWRVTEVSPERIGTKIGEVSCGVPRVYTDGKGNITNSEPDDGASYLCGIGTELFSVLENNNAIAAFVDGKYYLYVYTSDYFVPNYQSTNTLHADEFLEILKRDGYYRDGEIEHNFNTDNITNIVNITPKSISDETSNIEVFSLDTHYCFLMVNQTIYRYDTFGGYHQQLCLWDYDGNGTKDLVSYYTCGSGLSYLCVGIFNLTSMESINVISRMILIEPTFSFECKNGVIYIDGAELTYSDGSFHCSAFSSD